MSVGEALLLFSAVGLLALAVLSFSRGGKSVLGVRVGLLTVALGGSNFVLLASRITHLPAWGCADGVLTAVAPPLAFHVVIAFVGAKRGSLYAAYAWFGSLACASACAFFVPELRPWLESPSWYFVFLAGWAPVLGLTMGLLRRHLLGTADPDEKGRARLMLAAFAIGGALASTDVLAGTGLLVPRLAPIGTLIGALLVAIAAFRLRLFDIDLSVSTALYACVMAVSAVLGYLALFALSGGNVAALASGALLLTALVVVVVREVVASSARARAQNERLAVLGRFAAQMAHDIRNPLAAIVGAAQVIEGTELSPQQKEFLTLLLEQTKRISSITEKYERLARVESTPVAVRIGEIIERVASAQKVASRGIEVSVELPERGLPLMGDPDLIEGALENLVRNAAESMPNGGKVGIAALSRDGQIILRVTDTGQGMDPRRVERAFEQYFTTKPTGSGLGLPFVRRVALAHRGDASLRSILGKGTTVEMRLPLAAQESHVAARDSKPA